MLINGKFSESKDMIKVLNPYNGEEVGFVSNCTKNDVNCAVEAAKKAKKKAKEMTPYERYELLFAVYEKIDNDKEKIARLITKENGKIIRESRTEVERALQTMLFSAEESKRINGETLSADVTPADTGKHAFTFLEPVGVVAAICPFNFPLNLVLHKVGPAIAAGNTLVVKPATQTPLTAYEIGKMFVEVGVPPGLINVISGQGSIVGETLVKSNVDMISFTGSIEVGKTIAAQAGLKKISLELGGNGPLIITEDANIEKAIDVAVDGSFGTAGQRCTAVKRILLHNKIAEEFISKFVDATKKLKVGDPMNERTDVGPVIDEDAAIEIENRVEESTKQGAELLLGGKRTKSLYWPTILDSTPRKALIICKETFGPVAPIIRFDSFKEAIKIANETQYGLQAGIFTNDLNNIKYATKNIETGAVIVNGPPGFRIESLPFGGVKNSGIGREGVKYAIREMTEIKTVIV